MHDKKEASVHGEMTLLGEQIAYWRENPWPLGEGKVKDVSMGGVKKACDACEMAFDAADATFGAECGVRSAECGVRIPSGGVRLAPRDVPLSGGLGVGMRGGVAGA
ncbi:hypothetical protein [Streptomyces paromomycinus]|uniref:Uncharacterized protein n=1 Tax=Streptomyces paromomycinus TaxID=92743 RepID=A0A401VTT2_STREY|nr:hypothetical protein [Streptomyces paromomycinus]GCD40497.1 hypothetical protein GKJPGBOP_00146 [Streptomyces paromomycinus]